MMKNKEADFSGLEENLRCTSLQDLIPAGITDVSLAVGVFDGVHKGHQKLLKTLMAQAEQYGSSPVAMTFYPHPRQVLDPEHSPELLLPPAEKNRLLHAYGAKAVITVPFTKEFAKLSPEEFADLCIHKSGPRIRSLCVGSNWHFGAGGKGNTVLLKEIAEKEGFHFEAVPELKINGETVSSTSIRKAVREGDLQRAAALLGRTYALFGTIEHGRHVAGPKLDHPTANLQMDFGVLPPCGVYACRAVYYGHSFPAVCNIGRAPTFYSYGDPNLMRTEVHLLSGGTDLYGVSMKLELVQQIRPERKFESPEALKRQIYLDVEQASQLLKA